MSRSTYGHCKLQEEMGELNQVMGKIAAFPNTEQHPDGGLPLTQRLEDEIADVQAALDYYVQVNNLDAEKIASRRIDKHHKFIKWGLSDHSGSEPR